jgi:hypothetical protein
VKWVAWGALLSVVTFWGSVGLQPFYDDWAFPSQAALALRDGTSGAYLLTAIGRHWSPLWNLIALANLSLAGWYSDLVIRGITLVAFVGGLAWFACLARRWRLSPLAIAFGVAVLALHHTRAAALYSFDTYSQVLVDLASWVAAGLALTALSRSGPPEGGPHIRTPEDGPGHTGLPDRRWALAVLIPLLALLVKEQAAAGALAVCGLLAVAWARSPGGADRRGVAVLAALLVAGVLAFALARQQAGVTFADTEAYRLCPSCVPRNIGLLGGALVLPVRTLDIVDAWRNGQLLKLALATAGAGLVVGFIAAAFRRRTAALPAALLALSTFPVALLAHVGELYAHTAVFWFAMLMAVAADEWRTLVPGTARRAMVTLAMAVYLASLGVGIRANLGEMRTTGELAALWHGRYDEAVAGLPPGSVVLVRGAWPEKNRGDYGLYRLTSPDFVTLMWVWAKRTAADERLEVLFEWSDVDQAALTRRAETEPVFDLRRVDDGIEVRPFRPDGATAR